MCVLGEGLPLFGFPNPENSRLSRIIDEFPPLWFGSKVGAFGTGTGIAYWVWRSGRQPVVPDTGKG